MSLNASKHEQEHTDLVSLYAVRALPSSEIPAMETHISSCPHCQKELETLRPIVSSFVSWPTDVLRPAQSLWGRLARRIANETGAAPVLSPPPQLSSLPQWEEAAPGIHVKILATNKENDSVSMLVRLDPRTEYPGHMHAGIEELHLLDGVLKVDNRTLHPGDFIHAEAGSVDHRVWSETGCTCFLYTSTKDMIL
jgi:anti-sigma factor ChrR (cupin superfamily)